MRFGPWMLSACALITLSALDVRAELQRVEATGAIPLRAGSPRSSPPRDAAVRRALELAVQSVALGLLPGMGVAEAEEVLPQALGDDPFEFTTRFRITEDRGAVSTSLTDDPQAPLEYVVVVEANIDANRVEKRLREAGLMFARSGADVRAVTVVVEQLTDFVAYQKLLEALVTGAGANSAVPTTFARGRAVIAVEAAAAPPQLLEDLRTTAPPGLQITPLAVGADALTLRIAYEPVAEDPTAAGSGRVVPPGRN